MVRILSTDMINVFLYLDQAEEPGIVNNGTPRVNLAYSALIALHQLAAC